MARKIVVVAVLVVCLTIASLGSAFAAQGTITEVNPSGSTKVSSPGRDDSGADHNTGASD